MSLSINTNLGALLIQRQLTLTRSRLNQTLERLASGYRINSAADDAAGLAISERMRAQMAGHQQGIANAQLGVSMTQTADAAAGETSAILNRMRELAVQAGSNTLSADARTAIGEELLTLRDEVDNIASRTTFNGQSLLTGSLSISTESTIGPIADSGDADSVRVAIDVGEADAGVTFDLTVSGNDVTLTNTSTGESQLIAVADMSGDGAAQTLDFDSLGVSLTVTTTQGGGGDGNVSAADIAAGLGGASVVTTGNSTASFRVGAEIGDDIDVGFDTAILSRSLGNGGSEDLSDLIRDNQAVSTVAEADTLLSAVDSAISQVSAFRTRLGASENQLGHAINNVTSTLGNITAAESHIRDADVAFETARLARLNLQQEVQVAMLVQTQEVLASAVSRLLSGGSSSLFAR